MTTTLLVTVTGADHPGVTAALFEVLQPLSAAVDDIEQLVVHERLVLAVVVEVDDEDAARAALAAVATRTRTTVDVERHPHVDHHEPRSRHVVTLLCQRLSPASVAAVADATARCGANIDRIERLARFPADAYELQVSGGDLGRLRHALAEAAGAAGVDVAVQPASLYRRAKRLVCMDVDSTLVQGEVIELLAAHAGCEDEVRAVTQAAMRGELDFAASLRQRVALLRGLDQDAVVHVREHLQLTPGAETLVRTLHRLGFAVGIVSGGFTAITDVLAERLGLEFAAANVLETDADGRLTGGLVGPLLDRAGKAEALQQFATEQGVPLSQTVAVGDGANDLDMLAAAGLGIAFNAKPVVVDAARETGGVALSLPYLDAVLFLLGIPRDEVDAADAADEQPVPLHDLAR